MILLLGTRNAGKIRELKELLADVHGLELLSVSDVPFSEVEEDGETFRDNALLKARAISAQTGLSVLADDAGLEVAALGGQPGVRSARYSGEPVNYARNNTFLLERMKGITDRRARFVIVIALRLADGREYVRDGALTGRITEVPVGFGGFGYDPLFIPDGYSRTLAEMPMEEKNRISHRRQAIEKVKGVLTEIVSQDP
ncbi:MAG TPA: RdgB/HAM1 family non-canonical purine NTP pyrophosphatase [Candidatus Acetothermia bacterium]|nr:RdgB/HAM1 family non-canonical purine NTP pyrophosphatase [Candidatus Acetothermia bacterium]